MNSTVGENGIKFQPSRVGLEKSGQSILSTTSDASYNWQKGVVPDKIHTLLLTND